MPKDSKPKANALDKNIQFGAFALITLGIGAILFVAITIFMQQTTTVTESQDKPCEKQVAAMCDAFNESPCKISNVLPASESEALALLRQNQTRTQGPAAAGSTITSSDSCALLTTAKDFKYAEYANAPKEGSKIGTLRLEELEISMPLIEGTSASSLRKGAGHYVESVLPGIKDNSVISGHRETVFKSLGKLEIGHHVNVITSAGSFTYEVSGIRIVDANDRTVIVPTTEATLTLTTCYPFKAYGPKPERYIVSAQLISSTLKSSS